MRLLSIETSCDESAISVVDADGDFLNFECRILANEVASQASKHAKYGGVYPNLAKNEHNKNLPIIFENIKNKIEKFGGTSSIDAVAVTHGPGLAPALWTGVNLAIKISEEFKIPIVPVNHMEGHVLSALMRAESDSEFKIYDFEFPVLSLLVSGGHTQLILMKDWFKYELLGETLDDAVGEAFDKVARMMDLPYPGGPEISRLAKYARQENVEVSIKQLPRPMINSNDYNFSFSGLKTATHNILKDIKTKNKNITNEEKKQVALEFENAITEVLIEKSARAIAEFDVKTLLVAGGVSANEYLQNSFKKLIDCEFGDISFLLPHKSLTGDNSVMIAFAGYLRALKGEYINKEDLVALPKLKLYK